MNFTVKRSQWYRGQGTDGSALLREDGTRCCIGFVGQACGIADEALLLRGGVYRGPEAQPETEWPEWMRRGREIYRAYDINDGKELPEVDREQRLIALFAKHGDTLRFED